METNLQKHNNELITRFVWYLISFLSIFLVSYANQNELSNLWVCGLEDSIWQIQQKIHSFRLSLHKIFYSFHLARKMICFPKSMVMHDIVIGLFINKYEFSFQSS